MDDSEKRLWLRSLRARKRSPILEEMLRYELPNILEQQWFPKNGGRPKKSTWSSELQKRETKELALAVHDEMQALKARGYSRGLKDKAIRTVAKHRELRPEGLRRRLYGMDAMIEAIMKDREVRRGLEARPRPRSEMLSAIGLRGREISAEIEGLPKNRRADYFREAVKATSKYLGKITP